MVSPRRLSGIMADLAAVDHVRIIRLHTRVPVAEPARIGAEMVAALKVQGATTWVALHANHARELTGEARPAVARLIDAGIPMVSQSVLLKGVNDDPVALEALMRVFVECRIKPYYLHHGDLAPGTAHLRTTLAQGQELMRTLRGRVSGLCQPHYVLDIPGGAGKSPVGPSYLSPQDSGAGLGEETRYRVTDYCGDVHLYPPA
jgi:lysine 2,3-aminomutase